MNISLPVLLQLASFVVTVSLLSGVSNVTAAEGGAYKIMLRIDAWLAEVEDGSIDVTAGDDIDYSELNLDDGEFAYSLQAGLRLPILMNIHAGYMAFETDSDGNKLSITDLYAEASYGFNALGYAGVEAGVALHSLGSEVDTTGSVNLDDDTILPAVALRAWLAPIDGFDLSARLHWGELLDNTVLDAEIHLTWFPSTLVGIKGGYRYVAYEIDNGEDLDVSLAGPFVGLVAQF